jgi:4-aminobutyrate aminotransferase-like enzyme
MSTERRIRLETAIPGPRSLALRAREDAHLAPGTQGYALYSSIAVDSASGSTVTDVDGNRYLDFLGGIGVAALGHSHPKIVGAIQEQVAKVSVGSLTSEPRVRLVEKVAEHPPAPLLDMVQLYTGGAEAVESALRLAKAYTGKHEFVSFWGGFHGKTMGTLSLNGGELKRGLGPMVPGSHLLPYADCYRCPLALSYPGCGLACVELGRKQLRAESSGSIAAILVEPVQGTAGNVVPPREFLPALRDLAREHDALLIADEMLTGFGRTGSYWGVGLSGVEPDIVTIGKAFGGGFPLTGLISSRAITSSLPWGKPSGSSSSYGGNPLGAAAGLAALQLIDDERLVERAGRVGGAMLEQLGRFEERYPFVGHVRGAGLMIGIELVREKRTREPLSSQAAHRIFQECLRRGLLTMSYSASFRIQPALTLSLEEANEGIAVLREVFDYVAAEGFWR